MPADVRQRADVGLAVVLVADVDRRAQLDRPGRQVVHVLERRLARRRSPRRRWPWPRGPRWQLSQTLSLPGSCGDARGEGHRRDRDDRREVGPRACRGRCRTRGRWRSPATTWPTPYWTRSGSPARRRGKTSRSRRPARLASQCRAASLAPLKWPMSVRVALLMSTLADQRGVDVGDRVVEQLDDVLGVVGEGARVLAGQLVVVGGAQQARRSSW